MGNAGVFDNVELGTEADVFLRASLILCPHTPFWSSVQLSEQLISLPTPLSCHLPPSFPSFHRQGLQPRSIYLIGAPASLGSPSPPTVISPAMGIGPWGGKREPTSNMWLGGVVSSVKECVENVDFMSLHSILQHKQVAQISRELVAFCLSLL